MPDSEKNREKPKPREGLTKVEIATEVSKILPSPADLERFEKILPGFTDRILSRAEKEQDHRHSMEARGQVFAFAVALVVIVSGIALIAFGHQIEGGFLGGVPLAALVYVFLRNRWR